eukprot:COSAG03_NODE_14367_length_466_cov_5.978202_1_plen_65_part_10
MRGVPEGRRAVTPQMLQKQRKNEQLGVQSLEAQLLGDSEPERIAASYELAAMAHSEPLALSALQN